MKKVLVFLFKALAILVVPAVFVGLFVFALYQSLAVGLVIIFSAMVVQKILSVKSPSSFAWEEYSRLSLFSREDFPGDHSRELNFLFNLTKVAAILTIFRLMFLHQGETNPFGGLGVAIVSSLAVIAFLLLFSRNPYTPYINIRFSLGLIVLAFLLVFAYLYFGTQFIWLPCLSAIFFGFIFNGFEDLEDKLDDQRGTVSFFSAAGLLLAALVSTVIQFWDGISGAMIWLGHHILYVLIYELILGLEVWLILLGVVAVLVGTILIRKQRARRRSRRLAKAAQEKSEQAKAQQKEAELRKKRETMARLQEICRASEAGQISRDEIIYLAQNWRQADCQIPVLALTKVDWEIFFTISTVKEQIVWDKGLEDVLYFFGELYADHYTDQILEAIINSLKQLKALVDKYGSFKGATKFLIIFDKFLLSWGLKIKVIS